MGTTPEIVLLYSTFPDRESALKAAHALVEKRLVACVNVNEGITSIYRWEGKIAQENEVTLIAKTQQKTLERAINHLKQLHPYTVPCIVALPVVDGHVAFLDWVKQETN